VYLYETFIAYNPTKNGVIDLEFQKSRIRDLKDAGIPLNRLLKSARPQKNGLVKEAIEFELSVGSKSWGQLLFTDEFHLSYMFSFLLDTMYPSENT